MLFCFTNQSLICSAKVLMNGIKIQQWKHSSVVPDCALERFVCLPTILGTWISNPPKSSLVIICSKSLWNASAAPDYRHLIAPKTSSAKWTAGERSMFIVCKYLLNGKLKLKALSTHTHKKRVTKNSLLCVALRRSWAFDEDFRSFQLTAMSWRVSRTGLRSLINTRRASCLWTHWVGQSDFKHYTRVIGTRFQSGHWKQLDVSECSKTRIPWLLFP